MDTTVNKIRRVKGLSFFNYLQAEFRRGYLLENDEERYAARREKVYIFLKIPREIEKFLAYGFFQTADSFLFVLTFLPIRFSLAIWCLITRPIKQLFGYGRNTARLMKPAEIVDILKGTLLIICCFIVSYIDTSVCYHIIKTQSTIKLYLFFNMLEIADRLMSAFGQDTLDALFWTATEPRDRKREHFGILFHLFVASCYIVTHSAIVLLQALTLNVAINSDNKGLLTILISNNFVELKGAVFKKFDRNNLLQISCSDVRERFHICVLLFVVVIQTMKEYSWKEERLWILLPDCLLVLGTEILIDWLKHAFIIRFNDIPVDVYRDYTLLIASDLIMCKQKYAYSDHSDLVARRMGFIPMPLGVVIYRILSQSLAFSNVPAFALLLIGFLCLLSFRVLNGIVILGKACDLINNAELQRSRNASESIEKVYKNMIEVADTKYPTKSGGSANITPLHARRRNKTKEGDNSGVEYVDKGNLSYIIPDDSIENVGFSVSERDCSRDDNREPVDSLHTESTSSPSLKLIARQTSQTNVNSDPKPTSRSNSSGNIEDDVTATSAMGFFGESQFGLMANSMVNLASVGINQGVTDQNSSATITQDISPDISIERRHSSSCGNSPLIKADNMFDLPYAPCSDTSTKRNQMTRKNFCLPSSSCIVLPCIASPLTSTQSCPIIKAFCSMSSREPEIEDVSESSALANSEDEDEGKEQTELPLEHSSQYNVNPQVTDNSESVSTGLLDTSAANFQS